MNHIARFEIVEEVALHPGDVLARNLLRLGLLGLDAFDADHKPLILDLEHHRRIPLPVERHVAGNSYALKRLTPACLIAKGLGGDRLARAAPDLRLAVVGLERPLQRVGGVDLKARVDGGADRQAAREEFLLAKVAAQLAADLVGEIVARRQGGAEALVIARLNGEKRLRLFSGQLILG